jgi:hypothetical protein
MKSLVLALLATIGLLSGCVAYPVPYQEGGYRSGDRDRDGIPNRRDRDRDGDGVRNSQDRMPNNPNRY